MRLSREFFCRDPVLVARDLLGKLLVRDYDGKRLSGIVVETEAYLGIYDKASRGYGGRMTKSMKPLYEDCGLLYVYPVHMYLMLNVTTAPPREPTAVLIRALEPLEGIDIMMRNRGMNDIRKLCSGPGRLTKALGITKEFNGLSAVDGPIHFEDYIKVEEGEIVATKRIGVDYAGRHADLPLRFYIKGNKFVSKP